MHGMVYGWYACQGNEGVYGPSLHTHDMLPCMVVLGHVVFRYSCAWADHMLWWCGLAASSDDTQVVWCIHAM
jgi:hypothetical protein